MKYVTMQLAKSHLYIELDDHDQDNMLDFLIMSASAAVKSYLKSASPFALELDEDFNPVKAEDGSPVYQLDESGSRVISSTVQSATLLMIGYLFRDRDNNENKEYEQGYLPKPVTALLYPLRDPAFR